MPSSLPSSRQALAPLLALCWVLLSFLAAAAFGGNGPVAAPALVCAALFLTATTLYTTSPRQQWPVLPLACLGGIFVWTLAQVAPAHTMANPLWAQASQALGKQLPATISLNPSETLEALAQGLAYLGTFVSVWLLAQRDQTASLMLRSLALAGVAVAAIGLTFYMLGNTHVWNLPKQYYLPDLTATFINRNTSATFMGLAVLLNLAVVLERWGELPTGQRSPLSQRLHAMLNLVFLPRWGYLFGTALCFAALLLTHSRAGIACTILGVVVVVSSLSIRRSNSKAALAMVWLILLVGLAGTFFTLWQTISQPLPATEGLATRATLYRITAEALQTVPYTGSGLGTFEEVFRAARTPTLSLGISARVDHAHNTWLQLALELGLPTFILLLLAVGWLLTRLIRGLGERRRGMAYPAFGLGVSALVASHGLADFSLQIPGFAYPAFMALAMALAQSSRNTTPAETPKPAPLLTLALMLPLAAAATVALPSAWAAYATAPARATLLAYQQGIPTTAAHLSAAQNQLQPYAKRYANQLTLTEFGLLNRLPDDSITANALRLVARTHGEQAVSQNPANPYAWHRLAALEYRLGNPQKAAAAMAMSMLTGPFEPNLAWQRLPLLARLMPHLSPDDQTFARSLLHQLWQNKPKQTWQAAQQTPEVHTLLSNALADDPATLAEWLSFRDNPPPTPR